MQPPPAPHHKQRTAWNEPGHAHELTFSCQHRWPLLNRDRTRTWFIEALDRARRRWDFALWAYVIMPEHAHVLIYPRRIEYDVGLILKSIKQPVAQSAIAFLRTQAPEWLDRLRVARPGGRVEYRFWQQGGGYDRNVFQETTAWQCVDYLHANPVRRELCSHPPDWIWSSARWYEGLEPVKLEMDEPPPWPSLTVRGHRKQ
jgi:putative transposase